MNNWWDLCTKGIFARERWLKNGAGYVFVQHFCFDLNPFPSHHFLGRFNNKYLISYDYFWLMNYDSFLNGDKIILSLVYKRWKSSFIMIILLTSCEGVHKLRLSNGRSDCCRNYLLRLADFGVALSKLQPNGLGKVRIEPYSLL